MIVKYDNDRVLTLGDLLKLLGLQLGYGLCLTDWRLALSDLKH